MTSADKKTDDQITEILSACRWEYSFDIGRDPFFYLLWENNFVLLYVSMHSRRPDHLWYDLGVSNNPISPLYKLFMAVNHMFGSVPKAIQIAVSEHFDLGPFRKASMHTFNHAFLYVNPPTRTKKIV